MRIAPALIAISVAAAVALQVGCAKGSLPGSGSVGTYNSGKLWCTFRADLDDPFSAPTVGKFFPTDICWGNCHTVSSGSTVDPVCKAANDSYTYNDGRFSPSAVFVIITATACDYTCSGFGISVVPGDPAASREPK